MKRFRKRPKITRFAALSCRPVKNDAAEEIRIETGEVLLTYPVRARPWVEALIRRLGGSPPDGVRKRKLQLDELGSTVWGVLDGDRSVRQVIQLFSEKYQLHPKEAEVSVTRFLRELGKRGLIGLK